MSKRRLLLADDSITIQKVVNLTFADEGIDVITVGDGDAAMLQIAHERPDLVLADVHMPGPGGYEICSRLRQNAETADVPVILLVGSFEPFDPAEADRVGANAYVTKPFQSIRQLVTQVNELLATTAKSENGQPHEEVEKSEVVDTTDIDSLYHKSFAETVEMPLEMAMAAGYATDHLDDEMIETSYAAAQPDDEVEFRIAPEPGIESTSYNGENGQDFGSSEDGPLPEVPSIDYDAPPAEYDDLREIPTDPVPFLEVSPTNAPTEEYGRIDHHVIQPTEDFDLDEIDLLGITPHEAAQAYTFSSPEKSAEAGTSKQVVSLSPELIDVIVQKVVEKLSEKY